MQLTEDIICQQRKDPESQDQQQFSHMMHGAGCWDIDKTYWINFHQSKNTVTELAQIKKIIEFIK